MRCLVHPTVGTAALGRALFSPTGAAGGSGAGGATGAPSRRLPDLGATEGSPFILGRDALLGVTGAARACGRRQRALRDGSLEADPRAGRGGRFRFDSRVERVDEPVSSSTTSSRTSRSRF